MLLERFGAYLRCERGLAEGTIWNFVHPGRVFLHALEDAGRRDLERLSAADVSAFVVMACRERRIASAKNAHRRRCSDPLRSSSFPRIGLGPI